MKEYWRAPAGYENLLPDPVAAEFVGNPPIFTLINRTFFAPPIDEPIVLTFQLIGEGSDFEYTICDSVNVTIRPPNKIPISSAIINNAERINLTSIVIKPGDVITLDGGASNDPDNQPNFLKYLWTYSSNDPILTSTVNLLPNNTAEKVTFRAPLINTSIATLVFNLTVYDGQDYSINPTYLDINIFKNNLTKFKTLKIITNVKNDNGGDKKPSDFLISIVGNISSFPGSFRGTNESSGGNIITLYSEPGFFKIKPINLNFLNYPYSVSYSGDCTFDPATQGSTYPDREMVCNVTFDDKRANKLKVITNVKNDNGGDKKPSDFRIEFKSSVSAIAETKEFGDIGLFSNITGLSLPSSGDPSGILLRIFSTVTIIFTILMLNQMVLLATIK